MTLPLQCHFGQISLGNRRTCIILRHIPSWFEWMGIRIRIRIRNFYFQCSKCPHYYKDRTEDNEEQKSSTQFCKNCEEGLSLSRDLFLKMQCIGKHYFCLSMQLHIILQKHVFCKKKEKDKNKNKTKKQRDRLKNYLLFIVKFCCGDD